MNKNWYLFFIFFIAGCSFYQASRIFTLNKIELISSISTKEEIVDAVISNLSDYIYIATNDGKISIYSQNKKVNVFAGSGFSDDKFQNLCDLSIDKNGNIFALDDVKKEIKVFDKSGSFVQNIKIDNFANPQLIAISNSEKIFIYDGFSENISIIDKFNKENFTFGKFYVSSLKDLYLTKNNIVTYNKDNSWIFSQTGFYINYPSDIILDFYENRFQKGNFYLLLQNVNKKFFVPELQKNSKLYFSQNRLLIINNKKVSIYRLYYDKKD